MTPTIVVREGKAVMVLGSPGSSKIITTVANVLMGVVDYGMNIQEAVNAPRFHNQWMPDVVNVEQWFSPDTINLLRQMGYNIEVGLHYGTRLRPTGAMRSASQSMPKPASAWAPVTAAAAGRQ